MTDHGSLQSPRSIRCFTSAVRSDHNLPQHENAAGFGSGIPADRPPLPQAEGPRLIRAIRSICRAAWSFWLDDTSSIPDHERYCSNAPSISNFTLRK
jgi:hypothetical protein